MREINEIVLHCSATIEGKDYTVSDIRNWHLGRGYKDIGYHYVIYRDGTINIGRSINIAGAHTSGHNANSIGICYIGGVAKDEKTPKDTRTPEQRFALLRLVKCMMKHFEIPIEKVKGHYEYAAKACPSFNMEEFKKDLLLYIENDKNN